MLIHVVIINNLFTKKSLVIKNLKQLLLCFEGTNSVTCYEKKKAV